MIRVGVIGTGKHGSRYAQHLLHDVEGLTLGAISRRSAVGQEQAVQWRTEWYPDWRDLVRSAEVDVVLAAAPPHLNLEIARRCAQAGKPLLIEKPLARNEREAAEIVRVMAAADCLLTVGQTLRYNPVIRGLAERLPDMGELHSFHVDQRIEPSPLAWHDEPEIAGAGVVMHTAVHVFDALRMITGRKVRQVMAKSRRVHTNLLEDLMVILVELDNGVIGTVDVSKIGHARSGRYEFVCQSGQLHGDQIHAYLEVIRQVEITRLQEFGPIHTIERLLRDWYLFLQGEADNPVSGRDGHYAVAVCDACLRSVDEERWVTVEVV